MGRHFILLRLNPLPLGLIERDGGLSTLCYSCGFACQQRVLKTFPGPGYLHFEDGVVWLWHPLVNLYIWLAISSCYGTIPMDLGLIERDGGLSTLCPLCHSCGFACQQRVLKTFSGPGYLHSENVVVWLWHPLVNLYVYTNWPDPPKKVKFKNHCFFYFLKTLRQTNFLHFPEKYNFLSLLERIEKPANQIFNILLKN